MTTHYDVIIVGGRAAGATLAARLGKMNLKVLVVDKATFPCAPGVPSSPIIYDAAMKMLDELEIPESAYAAISAKIKRYVIHVRDYFHTEMNISELASGQLKREYTYAFERRDFDQILWENLERFPSVTRREDFSVTDVLRDEHGKITGIVGHQDKKNPEQYTADLVVGADGRFSKMAQLFGAKVTHEITDIASTLYYANWEGVPPFDDHDQHDTVRIFTNLRGVNILNFPQPQNQHMLTVYVRSELAAQKGDQDVQAYYLEQLQLVGAWIKNARQVTPLIGMKRVGNGYREAGGQGWALVGDAFHYKDPLDGQGLYDTFLGTKFLSEAIYEWKCKHQSWETALKHYETRMMEETLPMFRETTARLKREVYDEPPVFIAKTLLRWLLQNPAYKQKFLLMLSRVIHPDNWLNGSLIVQSIGRGLWKDITRQN